MGRAAEPPKRRAGRAGWCDGNAETRAPKRTGAGRATEPTHGFRAQEQNTGTAKHRAMRGHCACRATSGPSGEPVRTGADRVSTGVFIATGGKIRHPALGASTRRKMVRLPSRKPCCRGPAWRLSAAPRVPQMTARLPRDADRTPAPNGVRRAVYPVDAGYANAPEKYHAVQNAEAGFAGADCPHRPRQGQPASQPPYMKMEASSTAVSSAGNMFASGMRFSSSRLMPIPMTISPPVAVSSFITAGPSNG